MFKHILTATDGSDWALKGVNVAIDLAASLRAELTVLHVSEFYPDLAFADGFVPAIENDEARMALEARAHQIFEEIGTLAEARKVFPKFIHVANSHPATTIDSKAEQNGCDLIVIGSRGRRGLTKLFLGSQAAEVLAATKLPVMIVK